MSQWFQSQAEDFYDTGYKSWSHGMTNVSVPEVNMLKNSTTLVVCVPINLSIKLGFISVNDLRGTYFVDAILKFSLDQGSSTFWFRGPIYIFHIILRVVVIADYKIIMDILNIIIGAWKARQMT